MGLGPSSQLYLAKKVLIPNPVRGSLPKHSGKVRCPDGLKSRVEVVRDRFGIPHIYGESDEDVQFALGFCHAQDRLWQLFAMAALGQGKVAEFA